jgi:hypothetical protein
MNRRGYAKDNFGSFQTDEIFPADGHLTFIDEVGISQQAHI